MYLDTKVQGNREDHAHLCKRLLIPDMFSRQKMDSDGTSHQPAKSSSLAISMLDEFP